MFLFWFLVFPWIIAISIFVVVNYLSLHWVNNFQFLVWTVLFIPFTLLYSLCYQTNLPQGESERIKSEKNQRNSTFVFWFFGELLIFSGCFLIRKYGFPSFLTQAAMVILFFKYVTWSFKKALWEYIPEEERSESVFYLLQLIFRRFFFSAPAVQPFQHLAQLRE